MSTHEATLQQPLLRAIDLKKHYPVKKGIFSPERLVKALDGVSFNLERGKTLAVVGESGCGKSTLGRLLTMIETPTGGQRQRIAIARGLMLDPDVVIADEPVSALDVSVRAQVLNLMMDLQQDMGLSYVFISHDLSVVEHIADEVMVMYLGRCVEKGTKEQIFNNPRHPYTQALLSATPRLNPDDRRERIKLTGELPSPLNPPPGCAFNARCSRRFGPCTQLQPQLKEYDGQLVACFAVDQDENPQKPLS
ncbi:dipeptide ABC transporter ATP-binding protein [Salmonella enterica]|nr:dipeptide ABC transporter ATP-binding protein [Salmonella enterica]